MHIEKSWASEKQSLERGTACHISFILKLKQTATFSVLPSDAPATPQAKALVAAVARRGPWLHPKASVDVVLQTQNRRNSVNQTEAARKKVKRVTTLSN